MKSVKLKRLMFQYCIAKVIIFAAFLCYKTIHASFKQQNKHKIALKNPSQLRYEQTFEDVDRILTEKLKETTSQIECLQNKKYQLPKQFFVTLNYDIKSILESENAYNFADITDISKNILANSKQKAQLYQHTQHEHYRAYVVCCYYKSMIKYLKETYQNINFSEKLSSIFIGFNTEYNDLCDRLNSKQRQLDKYHKQYEQYKELHGIS